MDGYSHKNDVAFFHRNNKETGILKVSVLQELIIRWFVQGQEFCVAFLMVKSYIQPVIVCTRFTSCSTYNYWLYTACNFTCSN